MSVNKETKARIAIALTIGLLIILSMSFVYAATPVGPDIVHISNSTSAGAGTGIIRSGDEGGYITTITLDAIQQNFGWKAYVGNITGKLTLDNSDGKTIYDWTLASVSANVYISRVANVQWGSGVSCAYDSVIGDEDIFIGKQPTSDESINKTFVGTTHKQFTVAGTTIAQSTCPAISTWTSDTAQVPAIDNLYQEILLNDSAGNLIYTTRAETGGATGYDDNTYDFQAIVADDETPLTITNYYFYVEIGN